MSVFLPVEQFSTTSKSPSSRVMLPRVSSIPIELTFESKFLEADNYRPSVPPITPSDLGLIQNR